MKKYIILLLTVITGIAIYFAFDRSGADKLKNRNDADRLKYKGEIDFEGDIVSITNIIFATLNAEDLNINSNNLAGNISWTLLHKQVLNQISKF